MRISDWSSDVCSSDLAVVEGKCAGRAPFPSTTAFGGGPPPHLSMGRNWGGPLSNTLGTITDRSRRAGAAWLGAWICDLTWGKRRSGERRVGKEGDCTCRYGGGQVHRRKKNHHRQREVES